MAESSCDMIKETSYLDSAIPKTSSEHGQTLRSKRNNFW